MKEKGQSSIHTGRGPYRSSTQCSYIPSLIEKQTNRAIEQNVDSVLDQPAYFMVHL